MAFGKPVNYGLPPRQGGCDRFARRGFSDDWPGTYAVRARIFFAPRDRRAGVEIKPLVCGGVHADQHGIDGGPPASRCARAKWKRSRGNSRRNSELRSAVAPERLKTRDPARVDAAVARDLEKHRGACVVIPGEGQPAIVHALAHAMNASLGNAGKTVSYTEPIEANPVNQMNSLRELVKDMNAGAVELLVILGGNPVYDAPADFEFGPTLLKAKLRVHSGLYYDETAELCHWHVPETHFLEAWSDARAYDGTVGIVQPLIAPLYQGRSAHELIAALAGDAGKSGHDLVQGYWKSQRPEKDKAFDAFWQNVAARRRDGGNGVACDFGVAAN